MADQAPCDIRGAISISDAFIGTGNCTGAGIETNTVTDTDTICLR